MGKKKRKTSKAKLSPKKPIYLSFFIGNTIMFPFLDHKYNSLDKMTKAIKESFESPVRLKI